MSKSVVLDLRHKKFADEFLKTGKIGASAVAAGYSKRSCNVTGNKLLKRVDVAAYLAQRTEQLSSQDVPLQERVQAELEKMAFANIAKFIRIDSEGKPQIDLSTASDEQLAAISKLKSRSREIYDNKGQHVATQHETDIDMADKYRGLELLGKTVGMFREAEQRVIVDVADRLLNARRRLVDAEYGDAK